MQQEKGFIKHILIYTVIIIAILGVVFFSQRAYSKGAGKNLVSDATNQINKYVAEGSSWAASKIYPSITGAVQKRGDIIKTEVTQEKQKVSENIGQKISNYFSGIENSILHPGQQTSCAAQPNPTATPAK